MRIGIIQSMKELDIELPEVPSREKLLADIESGADQGSLDALADRQASPGGGAAGKVAYVEVGAARAIVGSALGLLITLFAPPSPAPSNPRAVGGRRGDCPPRPAPRLRHRQGRDGQDDRGRRHRAFSRLGAAREALVCELEPKGDLAGLYECRASASHPHEILPASR